MRYFGIHMAMISRKQAERIPDLLGYQNLLMQAHMQFEGDSWMEYDRFFRQNTATGSSTTWVRINNTFWNLTFSSKTKVSHCRQCFSLTQPSTSCDLAPVEQLQPLLTGFRPLNAGIKYMHGMEQHHFFSLLLHLLQI